MTIEMLEQIADDEGVPVLDADLPLVHSCSVQLEDYSCAIGIDSHFVTSSADKKTKLAHELGHCVLGAFYNRHSSFDLISRHEYRADRWAVEHLIPEDDLKEAMKSGLVEIWQLAEHFEVNEELVRKALWIYFDISE